MHLEGLDMSLIKYKLGDLIEQCDDRNNELEYSLKNVKGISTQKTFIETKANMDGVSLKPYKLVKPDYFAYVQDTSRRGDKIALAYNTTKDTYLISSVYTVFRVKEEKNLDSNYLFMYFNRPEFDRYSRFNSWGSARETFTWEDLCDIDIELPSLDIQQKYVDVYNAMLANQQSYEHGLKDLKLVCDAYIEKLNREIPSETIKPYIELIELKNSDEKYGVETIKGISINKEFIDTKADTNNLSSKNYKIVSNNQFAFNPNTARMGDKFSIALNNTSENILVSSIYPVFRIKNPDKIIPEYLMMFFMRSEFDRYVRFNSWGSARETFNYNDIELVKIPLPDIIVQKAIVNIFHCCSERKEINEKLKSQLKDICPVLIKGSIEEGKKQTRHNIWQN